MKWFAKAPANIALIKYMGKDDPANNIPSNPSLSYTLDDLLSFVEIEDLTNSEDIWEPLDIPGSPASETFTLSHAQQERFLKHLAFLKTHFGYEENLVVRSCNNFPIGTGLASSASSFAALTLCAVRALCELTGKEEPSVDEIAKLSQRGSGSSCRSFYSPWTLWDKNTIKAIDLPYDKLIHHVIFISKTEKAIPTSQAHEYVKTSDFFEGRPDRARENLKTLINNLTDKAWQAAYEIVWKDFWDMHRLFETADPPFKYITDETLKILDYLQAYWKTHQDGPLVTMDAGPNIHLLFRDDQAHMAEILKSEFLKDYDVI